MRNVIASFTLVLAVLLGGCMHESSTASVAIIDLDALAQQLGRREAMNKALQENSEELTRQLQASAALIKQKVDESLAKLRSNPTQEGQAAHQKLVADGTRKLEQQRVALTRKANEKRQEVVRAFRDEVRPAVQKVAMARGAQVVFTASEALLWAQSTVDITAEVLAELGGAKSN